MRISDLRRAVGQVELDDVSKQRMVKELKAGRRRHYKYQHMGKAAAAAVICIAAAGLVSIPVRALVNSVVQERMEQIPEEEIKATVEKIDSQQTEADGFSRDYTDSEKARHKELFRKYMDGTFPVGEVLQVDSAEEAAKHEFCYLTTTGFFYLPNNRELTDEEILEMIDLNQKRDYALRERYEKEYAEEIAQKQEQAAEAVSRGAITEDEAIEIAGDYLQKIFGIDGSGMEFHHYYSEAGEMCSEASYGVNWSIQSHAYYYFFIAADGGRLLEVSVSGEPAKSKIKPSVGEASRKAASFKEQAVGLLRDVFSIEGAFAKTESYYTVSSGAVSGENELFGGVEILFEKEDDSAYRVSYTWDGTFTGFCRLESVDAYKESEAGRLSRAAKEISEKKGEEITLKAVWE